MRAVQFAATGGPEVLEYVEVDDPKAGPHDLLVETVAVGVNFIDTYQRSGVYAMSLPAIAGSEGAGRIVAVGSAVTGHSVGERVAWVGAPGSYAERVVVPADAAIPVPETLDDAVAGGFGLQGLTAQYLARATFRAEPGMTALVHAGAGGVGLLLTQILVHEGVTVYTTTGSAEKAELSRQAGSSHVIRYDQNVDIAKTVRDLTGGDGVNVVYDGVGAATFDASLDALAVRGMLVLFGGASGQVPPVDLQRLNKAGSVFVTRPTLAHYTRTPAELAERADYVLDGISAGWLDVHIGATYPLKDAAEAHRALESRRTTGKVVLLP